MVQGGLAALFAPDSQFKRQENATSNATAANDAATKAKPGSKRKHQPSDAAASSTAKKVKNKTSKTNTNTTTQQPPQAPTGKLSRKQKKAVKTAASAATLADSDDEAPTTSAAAASTRHAPTAEEEAEKLQRTVFVGNLPADVKKKQIVRLFSSCGPVAAVRLRSVPLPLDSKMWRTNAVKAGVVDAARGSAHAYVVFQDGAAVDAALKLNMNRAAPRSTRPEAATNRFDKKAAAARDTASNTLPAAYDPVRSVFVGNLHFETQDEEVIRVFNDSKDMGDLVGQVEAVRCVRDGATNVGKGIAFVLFKDKAAARAALGLAGTEVHGRAIRVQRCKAASRSANAAAARVRVTAKGGSSKQPAGARKVPRVGAGAFVPVKDAPWQGTKTSAGRGKGPPKMRGLAPSKLRAAAAKTVSPATAGRTTVGRRKSAGKRPSVLARKKKDLATRKKS